MGGCASGGLTGSETYRAGAGRRMTDTQGRPRPSGVACVLGVVQEC